MALTRIMISIQEALAAQVTSLIHLPGLSYSQNAFVRSCIGPNA